ncbi:MAG TPA: hypothetical protein VLE99_06015 [Candidatus Saccharimonadales bacterium]|nr:hypothetical protein [Candidatus Saccharimonadales bacterium]
MVIRNPVATDTDSTELGKGRKRAVIAAFVALFVIINVIVSVMVSSAVKTNARPRPTVTAIDYVTITKPSGFWKMDDATQNVVETYYVYVEMFGDNTANNVSFPDLSNVRGSCSILRKAVSYGQPFAAFSIFVTDQPVTMAVVDGGSSMYSSTVDLIQVACGAKAPNLHDAATVTRMTADIVDAMGGLAQVSDATGTGM